MSFKKPSPSVITIWIIAIFFLISFFSFGRWKNATLIGGDPLGYYIYLPATFNYHDLNTLKFTQAVANKYKTGYFLTKASVEGTLLPNGNLVNKYTLGLAILHLPFFFLGYLASLVLGYPADGFSLPYQILIYLGSIFYSIAGLFMLRSVLRRHFSEKVVLTILITLAAATNLYFYSVYESVMTHSYLFFLYCGLLLATIRWYESLSIRYAVLIGICCGLITLMRPNEIISILIPLLYGVSGLTSLEERLKFIRLNLKAYFISTVAFIAMGLPQLVYWKLVSGKFLFYSYGNEGFDFIHPHILQGFFSFENGWLIYAPVMILAVAGIFVVPWKDPFKLPLSLYFVLYIYTIYSYWAWNYFNGFGSRPMVEAYAVLAIALGYFIEWIFRKRIPAVAFSLLLTLFVVLNVFQVWQYKMGILLTDHMNPSTYFYLLGKTSMDTRALIMYDIDQYQRTDLSFKRAVYTKDFNDSLDSHYLRKSNGDFYLVKKKEEDFLDLAAFSKKDFVMGKDNYLKISVRAKNYNLFQPWDLVAIVLSIDEDGKNLFWKGLNMQNKSDKEHPGLWRCKVGEWYDIQYFLCIPDLSDKSQLKFYLWDNCKCNEIAIDDFSIEVWDRASK